MNIIQKKYANNLTNTSDNFVAINHFLLLLICVQDIILDLDFE